MSYNAAKQVESLYVRVLWTLARLQIARPRLFVVVDSEVVYFLLMRQSFLDLLHHLGVSHVRLQTLLEPLAQTTVAAVGEHVTGAL